MRWADMRAEHAVESGREQQAPSSGPRPLEDTPPLEPLSAVRAHLLSCLRSRGPHRSEHATGAKVRPTEDDWRFLLEKTEKFAAKELDRYCWREVSGGVLPGGYDPSSVAAEAIAEFLRDRKAKALIRKLQDLRKHLRKRARKIVNRLHHRMENEFVVSECDLDTTIHDRTNPNQTAPFRT